MTSPSLSPDAMKVHIQIKIHLHNCTDEQVFNHIVGKSRIGIAIDPHQSSEVNRIRQLANKALLYTNLVCIDTEHYTMNSDEMTEFGIVTLATDNMFQMNDYGEHGDNLMRKAKYYFYRFREKAHLPTTDKNSRGPEGNRFGEVRFVTFAEMRTLLRGFCLQPIQGISGLEGVYRPVIILGHSVGHDREHMGNKDLAFNSDELMTIVKYVDTQKMAKQRQLWTNVTDDIGLHNLCLKIGFEHDDAHTALNDAARTLICAIHMTTPTKFRRGCSRSIQEVAKELEHFSQVNFVANGGIRLYCARCGSTQHKKEACQATGLRCDECASRGLHRLAKDHITFHCPVIAEEVVQERLVWYDQQPGYNPVTNQKITKVPFRSRLQTFAENAPHVAPASNEEIRDRINWYFDQRDIEFDQNFPKRFRAFTYWRRDFINSGIAYPTALSGPLLGGFHGRQDINTPSSPSFPRGVHGDLSVRGGLAGLDGSHGHSGHNRPNSG